MIAPQRAISSRRNFSNASGELGAGAVPESRSRWRRPGSFSALIRASLSFAMTAGGVLACPSCERRFELRRAGRSPDDEALQIAPVPLLRKDGRVRVALA